MKLVYERKPLEKKEEKRNYNTGSVTAKKSMLMIQIFM